MEFFAKIVICQKFDPLFSVVIYFCKRSLLDVWLGSKSASGSRKFAKCFYCENMTIDLISMNYVDNQSIHMVYIGLDDAILNFRSICIANNRWLLKTHMRICWLRIRLNRSIPYEYLNNFQVAYSKSFESVILSFQFKFVPSFLWHQFQFINYNYKSKILNWPSSIMLALQKRSIKLLHH